jgi:hypothetical protein
MGSGAHGSKIDGFPGTKIYPKSIAQEKTHKTVLMTKRFIVIVIWLFQSGHGTKFVNCRELSNHFGSLRSNQLKEDSSAKEIILR